MNRKLKKILSFVILSSLIILTFGNSVFAQSSNNVVKLKRAMVEKYKENYEEMSQRKAKDRVEKIEKKLLEMIAQGESGTVIENEMSKNKIYKLNIDTNDSISILSSQPNDAHCNTANIYYDSVSDEWIVSGGGQWDNSEWFNDKDWLWKPYKGEIHDVGGYDSVGIAYNNTSGKYNAKVVSSAGYMTDQNGWSEYSKSPSHGDGSLGVAFDFQDRQKFIGTTGDPYITSDEVTYQGKGYSALVRYDGDFANYHGNARIFYIHTWDECKISKLNFGAGTGYQFGVDIELSDTSRGWKIFSDRDTDF